MVNLVVIILSNIGVQMCLEGHIMYRGCALIYHDLDRQIIMIRVRIHICRYGELESERSRRNPRWGRSFGWTSVWNYTVGEGVTWNGRVGRRWRPCHCRVSVWLWIYWRHDPIVLIGISSRKQHNMHCEIRSFSFSNWSSCKSSRKSESMRSAPIGSSFDPNLNIGLWY